MAHSSVAVTHGTGTEFATDLIDGKHHQRIKLTSGVEGSAADVSADDPLPVDAASLPLPTGASSEDTLLAILAVQNDLLTAFTAEVDALPEQPLEATSDLTPTAIRRTTAGTSVIAAAVSGQTTRLHRYRFTCSGAVVVDIQDGDGNSLEVHEMSGAGGYEGEFWERPYAITPANKALNMVTDAAVIVRAKFWTKTGA